MNFNKKNIIYTYDGTFFGLLTIVFNCYVQGFLPIDIYPIELYINNFLEKVQYIATDEEKANRIFNGITKNISYNTLYNSYYAFFSKTEKKELPILKYIISGFKIGPKIENMLSIDYVWQVNSMRKAMLSETHKLKGLLRFQEVGENLFYSCIHPDNNVIENLGKHFISRLPTQNFIIHDKNRDLIFLYNTQEYKIVSAENFIVPKITNTENEYQKLWKSFFETISISERRNPRCQMNFMPKKYWKDLVEFS